MTATETRHESSTPVWGRAASTGATAGVAASMAMAGYAMMVNWADGNGFFTPLYHIAALCLGSEGLQASQHAAAAGQAFHLEPGPALLGAMIHMMTGAMYGAAFALMLTRTRAGRAAVVGLGTAWGLVVFLVSSFVGLPLAAAVFGSGRPISHFAEQVGWTSFAVMHLIFGATLGMMLAGRRFPERVR